MGFEMCLRNLSYSVNVIFFLIAKTAIGKNDLGLTDTCGMSVEVNSAFKAVTAGFYGTNIFPILGSRKDEAICPI